MENDSDWLLEQVRSWATASLAELLTGLGTPAAGDGQDPNLHVLVSMPRSKALKWMPRW